MFLNSFSLKTELDKNLFSTISQPTTESLIKLSLAKSKSKQVTEWYTQKFIDNIITFDSNMDQNLQNCFLKNFKKIASNPVGRALLFRILIEVQKDNSNKKLKKISVIQYAKIGFNEEKSLLYFDEINTKPCVIQKQKHIFRQTTYTLAEETTDNIDINIFHEMCHWFHALSNPERKQIEGNYIENLDAQAKALKTTEDMKKLPIARYFWGNIDNFNAYADCYWKDKFFGRDIATIEMDAQFSYHNKVGLISFEEVRTILGTNSKVDNYKEGDDLCENLYRRSKGLRIRWSHNAYRINYSENKKYYPDKTVLKRAINSTNMNLEFYKINDL